MDLNPIVICSAISAILLIILRLYREKLMGEKDSLEDTNELELCCSDSLKMLTGACRSSKSNAFLRIRHGCDYISGESEHHRLKLNYIPAGEDYAHPQICFFHVLFKAAALAFYVLSALFVDSFVIIFVVTVLLAALDFWVVKNVSGRILVGLRWWNEIDDNGESVWRFECLDQESMARMNKKDSWLFWWTLYLTAVAWFFLAIFSLVRFQADYLLVVGVCLTLSIANIVGFTRCRKDAKKQLQQFATQTLTSRFSSTIQSAFSGV